MNDQLSRRDAIRASIAGLAAAGGCFVRDVRAGDNRLSVRFGLTADCHIMGPQGSLTYLRQFVEDMQRWKPDFVMDLGDFACQAGSGQTNKMLHDAQLSGLRRSWSLLCKSPCPARISIGNHCVGWIKGGNEKISSLDLFAKPHGGEDITKAEHVSVTNMPGRYYSFDVKGFHFISLDANNWRHDNAPEQGHDGLNGGYYIDPPQMGWLARDLAANRGKIKIVFCHQELHYTAEEGSSEGGDRPFPQIGNLSSYVDNGWQARELFRRDGRVLACFHGHKHQSRWAVRGGTNYITLEANHREGSYAKVTISDNLYIKGAGRQRDYEIPLQTQVESKM